MRTVKNMAQFQSNLAFLKNPPKGYVNEPVDILGGIDEIWKKVNSSSYTNEFDFENDIAVLFTKAHDGHLNFDGYAYNGVFRFRRSRQITLISGSNDGKERPKIWAVGDFNRTGAGFTPSAVTKINDKDVAQFLEDESKQTAYHDPDTRYNAMFWMQASQSPGYFVMPPFYPGPNTTLTFENGTTQTYINLATIVQSPSAFSYVKDGQTFYETFIEASTSAKRIKKREENPHKLPRPLELPRDLEDVNQAGIPFGYPRPNIQHSSSDVELAGYFIQTSVGTVGILLCQTYNPTTVRSSQEFQSVIERYINEAKSRNVAKHVIDVRGNGGGKVFLGYDMYLQFFPSQKPQLQSRYRIHPASDLLGQSISTISFGTRTATNDYYMTPFNKNYYLDANLKSYPSWSAMTGAKYNSDTYTNLLRYNLSDPILTSSERYSLGVTMTGYLERSNYTTDPFKKEDLIILSDGVCASTCSLFTELMVQQSGVRTLAIGGRPGLGPMQPVGGTKGSLVLTARYLIQLSNYVVDEFAGSTATAREWDQYLPSVPPINVVEANINFQDNIRKGLERDGVPTQFLNDTASCRMWYQTGDYLNVTNVWVRAAQIAFGGKDGALDEGGCVQGSVTSKQAQSGQGEGNPSTGNTAPSSSPTGKKGDAGRVRPVGSWSMVGVVGMAVLMGSVVFGARVI